MVFVSWNSKVKELAWATTYGLNTKHAIPSNVWKRELLKKEAVFFPLLFIMYLSIHFIPCRKNSGCLLDQAAAAASCYPFLPVYVMFHFRVFWFTYCDATRGRWGGIIYYFCQGNHGNFPKSFFVFQLSRNILCVWSETYVCNMLFTSSETERLNLQSSFPVTSVRQKTD